MKTFKKLLVPLIIMLVLIIIVVIWAVLKPKNNESQELSESVVAMSMYEIQNFEVTSGETGETIGFTAHFDENGNPTYTLDGHENDDTIEVDQDKVSSYISLLCSFMSHDLVAENPTDLKQYGLDPAQYTISITNTNGEVTRIKMGNLLASGSYAYFMLEGDNKVYTVASIKYTYCGNKIIDFVNSQILDLQYQLISNVEFIRTTDDIDLLATCHFISEESGANYNFFSPMKIDASNVFAKMVDSVVKLKVASLVELTDEEVLKYRLDNPAYTFIFTMNDGEQVTIQFSDICENGMYYGKSSTTDNYFMVSDQQVNGFDTPIMSYIGEWICYNMVSDVSEIYGSSQGQEFTLTLDVANAISDADAKSQLDMRNAQIKFPDGSRTYSAILFETVACIGIGGIDFDATPDINDSIMTIRIRTKNYTTKTYDFVPRNDTTYYVLADGEYTAFYVKGEELFAYGGANTHAYGIWPAYWLLDAAIEGQVGGTYDINNFITMYEAQS